MTDRTDLNRTDPNKFRTDPEPENAEESFTTSGSFDQIHHTRAGRDSFR